MSKIIPYKKEILPQEEAEKLPYYSDLVKVRTAFENHNSSFPLCHCARAGRVVKLVTGLEELVGSYKGPRKCNWHVWNFDENIGLYIDLTQDQFLKALPGITILPSTTKVLFPNISETRKWREAKTNHLGIMDLLKLYFPGVVINY